MGNSTRNLGKWPAVLAVVMSALAVGHALLSLWLHQNGVIEIVAGLANIGVSLLSAVLFGLAAEKLRQSSLRLAWAWLMLGLAMLATGLGDIVYLVVDQLIARPPIFSLADGLYLLFYLFFLAGLFFFPVRRLNWGDRLRGAIDVVIVVLTAFLALWIYVMDPAYTTPNGQSPLETTILLVYPLADFVLLWAQMIVLFLTPVFPLRRSMLLIMAGLSIFIVSDTAYAVLMTQGGYTPGAPPDVGYSLAYLLFGLAAYLEIRMADRPAQIARPETVNQAMWMQVLPYGWVAMAYWILVSRMYHPMAISIGRVTIFVGLITLFIMLRQMLSLYENVRLSRHLERVVEQAQKQASRLERTNREMQAEILERQRMADRLSYDALHDGLTGLPNRALFLDRLGQAVHKKRRHPEAQFSVMFLDLDGFKLVNDSLGHQLGDELLIRVAGVLRDCLRASDTVARLGGDEFVILVENVENNASVLDMARRVQGELSRPIYLDGTPVYTSASIGVVLDVQPGDRPEDLLRDADLAMYQAKNLGKARFEVFSPALRDQAVTRMTLEGELRRALANGEFFLEYQPIFNLVTGRPVGFEALLRWQHPTRGRMTPADFVPVAEDSGLILPIGHWCLNEACRQAQFWQGRFPGFELLTICVNISARQFHDPGFIETVSQTLQTSGLPGPALMLEVNESVCLNNIDSLRGAMSDLRALGVEIQIDDFGTGYSTLGYLQSLPVNNIKIDRTFIQPIRRQEDPRPVEIVRAILAMMRSLSIESTAEGIETGEQLDVLVNLGCQRGQGYHLAMPMTSASLDAWMYERNWFGEK